MLRRTVRLLLVLLCLGLTAEVQAQDVRMRVVDEQARGVVFEITANWPYALRAALDSASVREVNERALFALAHGQLTVAETVPLPSLSLPRVRVVEADYDEVRLPPAEDARPEVLSGLDGAPAVVRGLGMERRRPAATLAVNLVTYDSASGLLRRYRRIVVAVEYPAPVSAQARHALTSFPNNPHLRVERSVLADGVVFKIAVRRGEEGIYRIDRTVLASLPGLGLSPDAIDPNHVRIFGNGGEPLPALNSAPRPADLVENPVFVRGGGDGSFDEVDAVWFYAEGPEGWRPVVERAEDGTIERVTWEHYVHPFSSENYYFIKIDQGTSNQTVGASGYPNFADAVVLTQIQGRHFVEFDDFMWSPEAGTGHTWVSNTIVGGGSMPLLQSAVLSGLAGGTVRYEVRAATNSNPSASVYFVSNGVRLGEANFGAVGTSTESPSARPGTVTFEQNVTGGAQLNLEMQLQNQIGNPKAAVDWVRVFYPMALRTDGGFLRFHSPLGEAGRFEMVLEGFAVQPHVWDVTDPGSVRRLGVRTDGGSFRVQVEVTDPTQPRELIAFTEAAVRPVDVARACGETCRVAPQNLHGIQSYPDFVIVAPEIFRPYAEELKEMRQADGLTVEVVGVEQIYNEFSGGLPDMRAVRDFFKFLYDRAPDEDRLLRYALLFGDGHFNFRNLGGPSQQPELENWILPFETEESFDPEESYTSDDYFGLLDDDEGLWPYTRLVWRGELEHLNERVDIGIGRFPVQTEQDARVVLDKIKSYENPTTYGAWRNRYLFFADDDQKGSEQERDLHTQNIDVVASVVRQEAPVIDQQKVYAISYVREFLNGWRVPGARNDLLAAIREGVLVANYSGHGGEFILADEQLFTLEDARSLRNGDRLPIFITATCSFGRWDLADEQSGAEVLLLNPDGGAVALMTTVRTVYTSGNATSLNVGLNVELNRQLFRRDEQGLPRRLGDVMRLTKNTQVGYEGNNRKFNLLGDPTMRLGMPSGHVVIQEVNGVPVQEQPAMLKALARVTVKGEVRGTNGAVDPTFDGDVHINVFDAERQVSVRSPFHLRYYTVREDLIWRGKVDVQGGRFAATFVVPKDISYSDQSGRISAYAESEQGQAHGFTENLVVGGTAENPPQDAEGPVIELYLNDETFVSGGLTTPTPRLIVELADSSGINTVGAGVGHEMLLIVDENEQGAIDIGDLYEAKENSYQEGTVTYVFEEPLSPGSHTVTVRAWDVLNNSSTASLDFVVSDRQDLELVNVYNYPNPTTGPTCFVFEHNQPVGTPARVQIRVYTLNGRPVATLERDVVLTAGPVQIPWEDGRDDDGDLLASGIYLYKLRVQVEGADGATHVSEHLEKLAVIR